MAETLAKIGLYFRGASAYWQLAPQEPNAKLSAGRLGRYPLNLAPRLTSGHFVDFDRAGLPLRPSRSGTRGLIHNYTTLCAFALGHWENYLLKGNELHRSKLLSVADYILATADRSQGAARLRTELPGQGHVGPLSAMFQGQAMSVLGRAWHATNNQQYLDAALDCMLLFDIPAEKDGILGRITALDLPWFEEWPQRPIKHALGGMIYSLWGLRDLMVLRGDAHARELFEIGVESVVRALPSFDTGFWSWYALPEQGRPYIASMMYHNLHICQLQALGKQSERDDLHAFASRFRQYAESLTCRMRAAAAMVRAKASNQLLSRS